MLCYCQAYLLTSNRLGLFWRRSLAFSCAGSADRPHDRAFARLTCALQSETVRWSIVWVGVKMRTNTAAVLVAFIGISLTPGAQAQSAASATQFAQVRPSAQDFSAQRRLRRSPTRIRVYPRPDADGVYPRYYPGPNAVRDCTATYVQEFRPSGTVITPRMNCFWRPG